MGINHLISDGPANSGDLERLADFVALNEATRHIDRHGPIADAVLIAAAAPVAAGHLSAFVAVAALIVWVSYGMYQNAQLARTAVRETLVEDPDRIASFSASGVDGAQLTRAAQHTKSAVLAVLGIGGVLLLGWNATAFLVVVVAQAIYTVYRQATISGRINCAKVAIDTCVSTTEWAQRWHADRARREAAAEEFLGATR